MKRVLIVEDDAMWVAVLSRYARGVDAEVRTVVSGGQAMDMIDSWQPDALVVDMLLAGETGMALLNELRSHDDLAKLPVVLCTGVGLKLSDVADFGVVAVLDKSTMKPEDVKSALIEVLYGGE